MVELTKTFGTATYLVSLCDSAQRYTATVARFYTNSHIWGTTELFTLWAWMEDMPELGLGKFDACLGLILPVVAKMKKKLKLPPSGRNLKGRVQSSMNTDSVAEWVCSTCRKSLPRTAFAGRYQYHKKKQRRLQRSVRERPGVRRQAIQVDREVDR